jgi:mono/diheme cytochrome c family protein
LRWGVAPSGSHYFAAFPFPFYNRLTAPDLADLWAFLKRVPAVRQPNRAGHPLWFAALRNAVAVSVTPFPGPWRPDPERDAVWNRGAYLVATVGRCGDCHTPRDWLGAPDRTRFLAGGSGNDGKPSPNITPDDATGIGSWSSDDIVNLLKTGQKPDFDFVGGAMGEIVDATSKLTDADRHAIAVYLKSLPPIRSATAAKKE